MATLTLDNPAAKNLIDAALASEIRDACLSISQNNEVRLVILSGRGQCFSVGREPPPQELQPGATGATVDWIHRLQAAAAIAQLEVPVLAAINGDALDHGLELALAADMRIASRGAKFGLTGIHGTGFPWDGGTQRLPRIVGPAWAADMILTGRVLDAREALKIGLVNRVVAKKDLADQVKQVADAVLSGGPIAARYAKEAIYSGMDLGLGQGLRLEADLNILLHSTSDRAEGLASFLDRRSPNYSGS